jgi:hypothetical protein
MVKMPLMGRDETVVGRAGGAGTPLVVYLDSQDYSRFGDVLRGRGDAQSEQIYRQLLHQKASGYVVFAYSMPILGELLQYDAAYAETTHRKAEAVAELCDGWALAFPSRLVAHEIATTAHRFGWAQNGPACSILTDDGYWYPNIAELLADLKLTMRGQLSEELATYHLPTRAARQRAKTPSRKMSLSAAAKSTSKEIGEKYGFAPDLISRSIGRLLEGKITPTEASRLLFSGISNPVAFVDTYFHKYEGDKTLPGWMSDLGSKFQTVFEQARANFAPFLDRPEALEIFRDAFHKGRAGFGANILNMADEDLAEFGVQQVTYDRICQSPELAWEIPICKTVGVLLEAYLLQTSGIAGETAKVERSFGGDLVHAFYLNHCDLWRGDRRFSHLVRSALPEFSRKVVSVLSDLPAAIDAAAQRTSPN